MDTEKLKLLVTQRMNFKRQEELAISQRRAIDALIAEMLPAAEGKRTVTESIDDGALKIKVSVERGETNKVDTESLQRDWAKLTPAAAEAFRWKAEIDARKFAQLADASARIASRYITTTPATPSIKITVE